MEKSKKFALYYTREQLELLSEALDNMQESWIAVFPLKYRKIMSMRATVKLASEAPDDCYLP